MPLQFQTVTIPLAGVDQKTAALLRGPGTLDIAQNVEYAAGGGRVNKRRGYQYVSPANVVGATAVDTIMTCVATLRDELVVFAHGGVYGLGDRGADLRGSDSLVYRGPSNRGACRVEFVSQSRISEDVEEGSLV